MWSRSIFRARQSLTVALLSLALTACNWTSNSQTPVENLGKTLSGNSFLSIPTGAQAQTNGFLWFFGADGNLHGLGQDPYTNEEEAFQGTWRIVSFEGINGVLMEGVLYELDSDGARLSRQLSLRHQVRKGGTHLHFWEDWDGFEGSIFEYAQEPLRGFTVRVPDGIKKGFPQRSEYNALLRKIQSAEPAIVPEPESAGQLAAQAAIMIPLCVLTALLMCM